MPILGAASKEGTGPEFVADGFVDVDDGEAALTAGSDVEAEPVGFATLKELKEFVLDEVVNVFFAAFLSVGDEGTELLKDLIVFEVDAG